mgnify:CR=1 FL=1
MKHYNDFVIDDVVEKIRKLVKKKVRNDELEKEFESIINAKFSELVTKISESYKK